MAWKAIYEDLTEYDSAVVKTRDLPADGIQAVIVDGRPFLGFEYLGIKGDTVYIAKDRSLFPGGSKVVRGRSISTRQFHEVELLVGVWHKNNLKPDAAEPDWKKDVIGWRVWTDVAVFDSAGIAEADWLAHWKSLPSASIQVVMLYENWLTPSGDRYRQAIMGGDFFYMAPSAYGLVISTSKTDTEAELATRYPGASIKKGALLPDAEFKAIVAQAMASTTFP